MIYHTNLNTPIGILGLVSNGASLLRIFLSNENISVSTLKQKYPNKDITKDKLEFKETIEQLTEYFDGKRKVFNIKTKLEISPFYKKALLEVAKVPYGETSSYSKIAHRLNNPKATRAVGSANARNPLPIIIPCHRIIAKNGKLGGYAGGLKIKNYLLDFEKNNLNWD